MFRPQNALQFNRGLDDWLDACEELADGAYRGLAVEAITFVVKETPQWSGNLAASWALSVGAPVAVQETVFKDITPPEKGGPLVESAYQKGSEPAVNYAFTQVRADGTLERIHLGVDVYISTGVPYAEAVETDTHEVKKIKFLRTQNLPAEMIQRAAALLSRKGELSVAAARALAARSV